MSDHEAYPDRYETIFSAAVDGNGSWFKFRDLMAKDSGIATLLFTGTWNSGTITIWVAADSAGTNAAATSDTLTADGELTLTKSPDCYIRATLSGSGGGAIVGTAQ